MQIVVWDTSAISSLSKLADREVLIAKMRALHAHWIPRCVLDEIASTNSQEERNRILAVCRELIRGSGRIVLHPWDLITAGVLMYWEVGFVDWEVLLETRQEVEEAMNSGTFDDDLAKAQYPELKQGLGAVEDWFDSQKPLFKTFKAKTNVAETVDDQVAFARLKGVFLNNVLYCCCNIIGQQVDLSYAEKFAEAFHPIETFICAYFIGHLRRNEARTRKSQAGAIDLLGAVYLPLCDLFISDDHNQQDVLRDVARCSSLRTDVLWFNGEYRKLFAAPPSP